LKKQPTNQQLHKLLELYKNKKFKDLEKLTLNFIEEFQNHPFGWKIRGLTLKQNGKLSEALFANEKVLKITPQDYESHTNLGNILHQLGKFKEAEISHKKAINIKPDYAEAYYNLSITLEQLNKLDEAKINLMQAIELKSNFIEAYSNLGMVLLRSRKLDKAEKVLKQAIILNSNYYGLYTNLGNVFKELGKLKEAKSCYQQAISLNPNHAESYTNLGNIFKEFRKLEKAEACHKKAISLKTDFAEAYYNLAITCGELKKLNEAIFYCQKALNINLNYNNAKAYMFDQLKHICDFTVEDKLPSILKLVRINEEAISPFVTLSWIDNAKIQLQRSKIWASKKLELIENENELNKKISTSTYHKVNKSILNKDKKIKVGFFSADFHEHAISYLILGLFCNYNKNQFEFYVFSYGYNKLGDYREKIKKNVNYFYDISELSDEEIIALLKKCNLEISIDLMGHTKYSRLNIFRNRLSPIQINFLGYPGTSGANFIEYIIADPIIIPKEQRQFYSEKVIYLPHTYQPNDDKREIIEMNTKKIDFNLPEKSFVFCCFNQSYKISKNEFTIWMRVMKKVENSVLWLLKSNIWAEQNLYEEAKKCGINPNRIIFAEKISPSKHLSRHQHADLFIDTFNYNAHTTASDALWSGLPLVTKVGNQFAARVAASLLDAVGMPELITKTEEDYEKLILEIAFNPKLLTELRLKLSKNKLKKPLFNTKIYTKHFESGLQQAYKIYCDGKEPEDIKVEDHFLKI